MLLLPLLRLLLLVCGPKRAGASALALHGAAGRRLLLLILSQRCRPRMTPACCGLLSCRCC
jgi:hypothetical protein